MAVAVAEAWRNGLRGRPSDAPKLAASVERLTNLEAIFVLGAVAAMILWVLIMLVNTSRATPRHSIENHTSLRRLFLATLVMVIAMGLRSRDILPKDVSDTIAMCALMWAPFALISGSALRLATSQVAVRWWYAMLCGSLVLHQYFTSRLDLNERFDATLTGRTALLHASSALMMGLAALFAADSTASVRDALNDRVNRHQHLLHDARSRAARIGPDLAAGM
jgi:hypothetical protein